MRQQQQLLLTYTSKLRSCQIVLKQLHATLVFHFNFGIACWIMFYRIVSWPWLEQFFSDLMATGKSSTFCKKIAPVPISVIKVPTSLFFRQLLFFHFSSTGRFAENWKRTNYENCYFVALIKFFVAANLINLQTLKAALKPFVPNNLILRWNELECRQRLN